MKIFLCRHGRTDHNKNGIVQGYLEVELNEEGEEQARKLARRLSDLDIDSFYTSPLVRTVETATIVSQKIDADHETLEDLREVDQGIYEGEDSQEMFEEMRAAEVDDHRWTPEDGESMEDLRERSLSVLETMEQRHQDENVLLIGHGGINKVMILAALGHSSKNFNRIKQENCCLNVITTHESHGWVVEKVNDTSHLG